MGLKSFLKCRTVADYMDLKNAKKVAEDNGEVWDEKEWFKKNKDKANSVKTAFSDLAKSKAYDDGPIKCPKCGSTQITAGNKGFSVGKAIVGDVLVGPVGLVGGAMGSKKTIITCLQCGHKWKAGK